ncbi:Protein arginine N-methyltransferase 3 [Nowakowskiella sp. JEL0407]|nr:Protein arginine N-methyltransferase 3 [Nowakowskiella sp. JEL0407]
MSVSSNDSAEWSNWEGEEEAAITLCLFCKESFNSPSEMLYSHCKDLHKLDLTLFIRKLSFYEKIKFFNYLRKCTPNPSDVLSIDKNVWDKEEFLIPIITDDPLLFGLDDDEDSEVTPATESKKGNVSNNNTSPEISQLQNQLADAEFRALNAEARLAQLQNAFAEYKDLVQATYLNPNLESVSANEPNLDSDYYFESYASLEIHETMLKDYIRTDAYRDFILGNPEYFQDKIVLDVGCGTGILSMFAAKAGAKHVYAVDNSSIIKKAKRIAEDNGFKEKITFVEGAIESIELPVDSVDIIVSEWMGYFLLYESMLDSVIVARDRYLSPSGTMAPSHSNVILCAIDDDEWLYDRFRFWDSVYGFKMAVMKEKFTELAHLDIIHPDKVISDSAIVAAIDTNKTTTAALDFASDFTLKITKKGRVTAICGYFDILFDMPMHANENMKKVTFSTGPADVPTHWKQSLFVLNETLDCNEGDEIKGYIDCVKSKTNHRELVVTIDYEVVGRSVKYRQVFNVR